MALELTGSIDITTGAAFTDQDGRYSGSFSGCLLYTSPSPRDS